MYVEDLLSWVRSFATEEGPRLIQDGGKFAVGEAFAKQAGNLQDLVSEARHPSNKRDLPSAYFTGRVKVAWEELYKQLKTLVGLAEPIKHDIEPSALKDVEPLFNAINESDNFTEFKQKAGGIEKLKQFARARRSRRKIA